jgi:hypothetical protein
LLWLTISLMQFALLVIERLMWLGVLNANALIVKRGLT